MEKSARTRLHVVSLQSRGARSSEGISHKVVAERDCGNSGHVRAYARRARGPHTIRPQSYNVLEKERVGRREGNKDRRCGDWTDSHKARKNPWEYRACVSFEYPDSCSTQAGGTTYYELPWPETLRIVFWPRISPDVFIKTRLKKRHTSSVRTLASLHLHIFHFFLLLFLTYVFIYF